MRKTLTYSSFAIAVLVIIAAFLTATTYTQLGIAVLLYPVLAYSAYKLFFSKNQKSVPLATIELAPKPMSPEPTRKDKTKKLNKVREVGVIDIEKRAFLKLIGATGLSFLLFSIFGKKIEPLLPGATRPEIIPSEGTTALPTDGYQISEIDDGLVAYYGFINKDGGWFIMKEDPDKGSFRYKKGDSDFSSNWLKRKELQYDYYYNVFP